MFKEFREDGWPLCPNCGKDELFSHLLTKWNEKYPKPELTEILEEGFSCYHCGFMVSKVHTIIIWKG